MDAQTTVDKALDVLFQLHGEAEPQGVTAIGRALGLPKSSAHRLLSTLCRRGLVERDERGRYRPGIGLVALGLGALEREPLVAAARPVLEAEAEALGETVFLVGLRDGRPLVLEKCEGSGFLRVSPRVGSEVPVHATAVGKLFLALAEGDIEAPSGRLEAYTAQTPRSARALADLVAEVRRKGWAESREEWIPGMSVVAAPVSVHGRVRGALAIAASTARLDTLGTDAVARRAVNAAGRISARLEGRSL